MNDVLRCPKCGGILYGVIGEDEKVCGAAMVVGLPNRLSRKALLLYKSLSKTACPTSELSQH